MVTFKVTEEDMKRNNIFYQVKNKEIKLKEASLLLSLSYRHTLRLYQEFKKFGLQGIIKKYNNSGKNQKLDELAIKRIIKLKKNIYFDFNILHFKEKLEENHSIIFSYESIRQLLINEKVHIPKKRKKVYRRRRRMPKAGLMVQMDSSQHHWIPDIKEKWWLIAGIDDASNEVPHAFFTPSDTNLCQYAQYKANDREKRHI